MQGNYNEHISKTFHHMAYIPVRGKHFPNVEINIRDNTGRTVAVERGKVLLILHFRQWRALILPYACSPQAYIDYYTKQAGGGGLSIFCGVAVHRGHGLLTRTGRQTQHMAGVHPIKRKPRGAPATRPRHADEQDVRFPTDLHPPKPRQSTRDIFN